MIPTPPWSTKLTKTLEALVDLSTRCEPEDLHDLDSVSHICPASQHVYSWQVKRPRFTQQHVLVEEHDVLCFPKGLHTCSGAPCASASTMLEGLSSPVSTFTKLSGVTVDPRQSMLQPAYTSTPGVPLGVGLLNSFPGYGFCGELATSSYAITMMFSGGMPFFNTTWYAWHTSAWCR